MPHVGSSAKRGDDPRLLTGRGRYVDDVTLPRMVHVAIVRSPHAHARIVGIDVEEARRAPGVRCVLVGADTDPGKLLAQRLLHRGRSSGGTELQQEAKVFRETRRESILLEFRPLDCRRRGWRGLAEERRQ